LIRTAPGTELEDLLRHLAPQVLGAVVRRYGHFDTAEDAVQEALLAAALRWPKEGVPDNPRAWLITVAARRLTDLLRAEQARRRAVRDAAARRTGRPPRRRAARALPDLQRGVRQHRRPAAAPGRTVGGGDPADPAAAQPAARRRRGRRPARAHAAHRRPPP